MFGTVAEEIRAKDWVLVGIPRGILAAVLVLQSLGLQPTECKIGYRDKQERPAKVEQKFHFEDEMGGMLMVRVSFL